jgi:FtsH-binding integral membrane protein
MQPDGSNFNPTVSRGSSIDAGLQGHMQRVYNRMTAGVLITALTAWFVGNTPALLQLFMGGPQAYIIMLAPLAIVWFGFRPERMAPKQLMLTFGLLAVLYGISFATIFQVFTGESIARAFFMATGLFAGLSIFGYVTKKNLDGLGTFAVMGVIGVLVLSLGTMVAGLFGVDTSMMQTIIAGMGLLAFSGVTAWQTQSTKEMYHPSYGDDANSRMAWSAALTLYVSFIAIFQYILHFVGNRE